MPGVTEAFFDAAGPLSAPTWARLFAAISASDSTLRVIATPANNPTATAGLQVFRINIDVEQLLVTATSGTTWTVQRGVNGTTAAAHNANADVLPLIAAPSFNTGGRLATTATHEIAVAGALVGTRHRINLLPGTNIGLAAIDNAAGQSVDVTITSSGAADAAQVAVGTQNGLTGPNVQTALEALASGNVGFVMYQEAGDMLIAVSPGVVRRVPLVGQFDGAALMYDAGLASVRWGSARSRCK